MDDFISRQAAITQLSHNKNKGDDEWELAVENDIQTIWKLPPAQPKTNYSESPNTSDCISREQAIDALERAKQNIRHNIERAVGDAICEILDTVESGIKQLPPIQPKKGKWIKTARWGRVYYCNQCRNYLDFDGVNAGRGSTNFCPNCGADMRGDTYE